MKRLPCGLLWCAQPVSSEVYGGGTVVSAPRAKAEGLVV